jgi:hypothetical protein
MPYVPSKKTDGKATDREVIDVAVEQYSNSLVNKINTNYDVVKVLEVSFGKVGVLASNLVKTDASDEGIFIRCILEVGEKYGYEGAFLGELNYACTRVIQRTPQLLAQQDKCGLTVGKELRYWLYAMIVSALTTVSVKLSAIPNLGVSGVFEDIKDEYKVRVNKSYEIEQILKSGDCYDTPYFNKVIEIVDEDGKNVGYTYIELKNDGKNVKLDAMPYKLVVKNFNEVEIKKEVKNEKYL